MGALLSLALYFPVSLQTHLPLSLSEMLIGSHSRCDGRTAGTLSGWVKKTPSLLTQNALKKCCVLLWGGDTGFCGI